MGEVSRKILHVGAAVDIQLPELRSTRAGPLCHSKGRREQWVPLLSCKAGGWGVTARERKKQPWVELGRDCK